MIDQATDKHYLDRETVDGLMDLVDGDGEMIIELIDTLLETTPDLLISLQAAVEQKNAIEIREAAHALKSSTANMGALKFSELCGKMEHMGKTNDLDGIERIHLDVKLEYSKVESSMTAWRTEAENM